jgi:hypothetical protein
VQRILPGDDDFDAVIEAEHVGGPAESWYG